MTILTYCTFKSLFCGMRRRTYLISLRLKINASIHAPNGVKTYRFAICAQWKHRLFQTQGSQIFWALRKKQATKPPRLTQHPSGRCQTTQATSRQKRIHRPHSLPTSRADQQKWDSLTARSTGHHRAREPHRRSAFYTDTRRSVLDRVQQRAAKRADPTGNFRFVE